MSFDQVASFNDLTNKEYYITKNKTVFIVNPVF